MTNKKNLIEICLNLNDGFSNKDDVLNTSGLVVIDSFIINDEDSDNFLSKNMPVILKGLVEDSKELYKNAKSNYKISKKDFIIRIQPLGEIIFLNI